MEKGNIYLWNNNGDVPIEFTSNGLLKQRWFSKSAHQEQIIDTVLKISMAQHVFNML